MILSKVRPWTKSKKTARVIEAVFDLKLFSPSRTRLFDALLFLGIALCQRRPSPTARRAGATHERTGETEYIRMNSGLNYKNGSHSRTEPAKDIISHHFALLVSIL